LEYGRNVYILRQSVGHSGGWQKPHRTDIKIDKNFGLHPIQA